MLPPNKSKAKSYDDQFLDFVAQSQDYKNWANADNLKLANQNAFDFEQHQVDFDSSNQDFLPYQVNPFLDQFADLSSNDPYAEIRAQNQSDLNKGLKGVGRALTKGVAEIAKMPGVIGGLIAAPFAEEGEGFETAFNNEWIKSINNLNETVNTELLPVYVKKAVEEGNLWDNISSVDFWATEGADGIGYIASMLAPGAALKSLNIGNKILGTTAKGVALANGEQRLAGATRLLTEMGVTAQGIDLTAITLANTLFEAGSESGHAMENFQKDLDSRLELGEIDDVQYEQLLEQKGKLGRDIFLSNVAILLGPNAIQSKMIWGKAGAKQLTKETPSILRSITNRTKDIGKATLSEGFFEEGGQSTVESMFTEAANKGQLTNNPLYDFNIGELADSYLDTVSSTDGQKAIFLGAFLGGGMYAFQGSRQDSRNRQYTNHILNLAEERVNNFNSIYSTDPYQRDSEGNIQLDENNLPVYDPVKVNKIAKSLYFTEEQNNEFEKAVREGNEELVNQYKEKAINQLISPFITEGDTGIQALQQYLEQTKPEEVDSNIIPDIISKAEYLKDQYQAYKDFSSDLINLQNENANPQDIESFYNDLADTYINLKAEEYRQRNNLQNLINKKNSVIKDIESNNSLLREDNPDFVEGQTEDIYKTRTIKDPRIKELDNKIKQVRNNLKEIDNIVNNIIWNSEEVNKAFDEVVNNNNRLREENSPENIEKVNSELESVSNAVTEEELNEIKPDNSVVQQAKENKKEDLKEAIRQEEQLQKQSIFEEQEISPEVRRIELENQRQQELSEANEKWMSNVDEKGFPLETLPSIEKEINDRYDLLLSELDNENNISNPNIQNSTDGVDDSIPVTNNENKLESPTGRGLFNGAKAISTNRDTGEKLDFVSEEYLAYERTPRNKTGERVNFEINNISLNNPYWTKALEMYNNRDFSNLDYLYNHLPLNIKFTNSVIAPMETLPRTKDSRPIFEQTTLPLRKAIVDYISKGGNIGDISSVIEGQYEGSLKVQPQIETTNGKLTPENSILDLQILKGKERQEQLEYLTDNLYMVNWTGALENIVNKDKLIPTNLIGKGEIYLQIPTNNGKPFNLKLNFKRIEDYKGNAIYNLLRLISQSSGNLNQINTDTTLKQLKQSNNSLYEELFNDDNGILANEVKLYSQNAIKSVRKSKDNITLNNILDILVFKDSTKAKTLMNIDANGNLNLGSLAAKQVITKSELEENLPETQQIVLDFLKNKRYNVLVTKGEQGINFNNPSYLNYILDNNILSTNAIINEPTFQGYSNIYISSNPKDIKIEIIDLERNKVEEVKRAFEAITNSIEGASNKMIQDIVNKINNNEESYEKATQGLPKSIISAIDDLLVPLSTGLDSINTIDDTVIEERITEERNKFLEKKLGKNASIMDKLKAVKTYSKELEEIDNKFRGVKNEVNNNTYTPTIEEVNKIIDVMEENTPSDRISVTEEVISDLTERLGVLDSEIMEALSKDTNETIYEELVKLANQREVNIEDIQKRCK